MEGRVHGMRSMVCHESRLTTSRLGLLHVPVHNTHRSDTEASAYDPSPIYIHIHDIPYSEECVHPFNAESSPLAGCQWQTQGQPGVGHPPTQPKRGVGSGSRTRVACRAGCADRSVASGACRAARCTGGRRPSLRDAPLCVYGALYMEGRAYRHASL